MSWDRGAWERKTSEGGYYNPNAFDHNRNQNHDYNPNAFDHNRNQNHDYNHNYNSHSRSHTSSGTTTFSHTQQMNNIIEFMRKGSSLKDACVKLGIPYETALEWYNKGQFGEGNSRKYKEFYHAVSSIRSARENNSKKTNKKYNKRQHGTSIPKSSSTTNRQTYRPKSSSTTKTRSNIIKCPNCGNRYNKLLYDKCPSCKKSKATKDIQYCQNCGKKLNEHDMYVCSICGTLIKRSNASNVSKSNKKDSFDWLFCCGVIFVIFLIIVFLSMI